MTDAHPSVLIVEDEADLARLYETWVPEDWTTTTVADCESAVAAADARFDVVVLDRRLPDGDGATLLADLRAAGVDAQVVMVTAVEPDFDIIEMGIDAYLVKTVDRDTFRDALYRLRDRVDYDEQLREYYALVSKLAVLEARKPASELAESEEYQELRERVAAASGRADAAREDVLERAADEVLFRDLLGEPRPSRS